MASQHYMACSSVERLGHEQEVGWLDSIAQELVGCCDALTDNPGVSAHARYGVKGFLRGCDRSLWVGIRCPSWTALPKSWSLWRC
jgi:hypothetical protein